MDVLALSSSASAAVSIAGSFPLFPSSVRKLKNVPAKHKKFVVSASKREEPKLSEWDQMELKFGRLLGEDPKLTIAKIVARKVNPEASFVEVEKSFYKNKGKLPDIETIPLDWSKEEDKKQKNKPTSPSLGGLNLVKPVPKDGVKFEAPVVKKPNPAMKKPLDAAQVAAAATPPPKRTLPNVILRKPSSYYVNNDEEEEESKLRLKRNLTLKMRNDRENERFSDMTLLRKPEPVSVNAEEESPEGDGLTMEGGEQEGVVYSEYTLLEKPEARPEPENVVQEAVEVPEIENASVPTEMQLKSDMPSGSSEEETISSDPVERIPSNPVSQTTVEASLQGKPQRLDPSSAEPSVSNRGQPLTVNQESRQVSVELKGPPTRSSLEESDWNKAESLVKTELRADVELISSSTRGFAVSYGSLIGFLPYRNLAAKWKFLAFESWLRRKGVDPSLYRQNLGVIGGQDVTSKAPSPDSSSLVASEVGNTINGEVSSDMKLEDLLMVYDREKQKFLSSFVGQKIKVNVVMANRNSRKLIFSMRPRENEEEVEKKRNLMAKLRVGDVVKCCIKKITYFGIFCELEGVPALIHQSEVSWDATLDPASYFKIGQIVEAKVHQLDFALERIFLSLKEITPDPLTEALESVVGDNDQLGKLQAAELDAEWPDVESLIKEMEMVEGIQSVSKGRFFLSPGLAPTFQVYMAPMFENQYKLLARAGNRVQELIVEASLSKEEMKTTIMSCTNRVE
ncbi:hypothetical protein Bca52824_062581 [Brassica carinata]|uniref:S1 motif domain-containing protein n=1 Tax=Brassica carinata TaxID=52824 RepID=A0A8X7U9J5_BRACI|nr:hypothetical protein Bca52824_062581 [Brassica carinata]